MPQSTFIEEERDTKMVPASDPRAAFISVDPQRMSGTPCFVGSRVPIKHLWDYLEGNESLETFFDDFEGVPRESVLGALWLAYERLLADLPEGMPRW